MNLDNSNDKQSIQETLKRGIKLDFWNIICQAIDRSIAHIQKEQDGEDIKSLPADQYKLENEILKAKKSYLEQLKDMPLSLIDWLESPEEVKVDYDPYEKPKVERGIQ